MQHQSRPIPPSTDITRADLYEIIRDLSERISVLEERTRYALLGVTMQGAILVGLIIIGFRVFGG
jgi:hypothetical protein